MKNLVLGVVGDTSLHKTWLQGASPEFDLFLVYYGDLGDRYRHDAIYYDFAKGTKFIIVDQMIKKHKELFDHYDAVLIPDDDILINASGINKFFSLFHEYDLMVAQPAIMGWISLYHTAANFTTLLRYVRCVEIMTPCLSRQALEICKSTFTENKTNWGIEWLWWNLLGEPKNKLAVIDDVVAIHSRPCFFGDTYHRNGTSFDIAVNELKTFFAKHNIEGVNEVFGSVPRDESKWYDQPSEHKLYPNNPILAQLWASQVSANIPI